jgi:hypothetical protein
MMTSPIYIIYSQVSVFFFPFILLIIIYFFSLQFLFATLFTCFLFFSSLVFVITLLLYSYHVKVKNSIFFFINIVVERKKTMNKQYINHIINQLVDEDESKMSIIIVKKTKAKSIGNMYHGCHYI